MDKPAGITSHDVVARLRRVLRTRSVGHTGTLDPFATGLLVLLVGRATRLARFLAGLPKTYLATARLGLRTTTDDLTGEVVEQRDAAGVSEAALRDALAGFLGSQSQRPPQFSAKRVEGERSYRRARRGEDVPLSEALVTVHRMDLIEYRPPEVTFRAVVSAGTYIRSLARDLGERLGVGAHLSELRREAVGELRVDRAVLLAEVTPGAVLPVRSVLGHLPALELNPEERRAVAHGRAVPGDAAGAEYAALVQGQDLVAVARAESGWLRPAVVLESA